MKTKLAVAILLVSIVLSSASVKLVKEGEERFSFFHRSNSSSFLSEDYYRHSCPRVEVIIRSMLIKLYASDPSVAPALLRLVFHDCFVRGCDGSVLLNSTQRFKSEKESAPNLSLRGFDVIDSIKANIETQCPGTVSCADILVLAARDSVFLIGGPYYNLKTGRRDSHSAYYQDTFGLPAPDDKLSEFLPLFKDRGFFERETVALLGGHNIGTVHCQFLTERLTNFSGTGRPDPSIEPSFLRMMVSKCMNPQNGPEEPGLDMGLQTETGPEFGVHYYKGLVQGKGILSSDQELITSEDTSKWVQAYKSDWWLFQKEFANVMMKLSNLEVLTKPAGRIRRHCAFVS